MIILPLYVTVMNLVDTEIREKPFLDLMHLVDIERREDIWREMGRDMGRDGEQERIYMSDRYTHTQKEPVPKRHHMVSATLAPLYTVFGS